MRARVCLCVCVCMWVWVFWRDVVRLMRCLVLFSPPPSCMLLLMARNYLSVSQDVVLRTRLVDCCAALSHLRAYFFAVLVCCLFRHKGVGGGGCSTRDFGRPVLRRSRFLMRESFSQANNGKPHCTYMMYVLRYPVVQHWYFPGVVHTGVHTCFATHFLFRNALFPCCHLTHRLIL